MKNNKYICYVPYLRNNIAFNNYFQIFKILIFWVVSGVKEQKVGQNDKKLLVHFISQEPFTYHMINIYGGTLV